jgi:hypothetical protein
MKIPQFASFSPQFPFPKIPITKLIEVGAQGYCLKGVAAE